jgi:spore maturation protein CgeB
MNVLYSFNKIGYEGECWKREIRGASSDEISFSPFNHQDYLEPRLYADAVSLDRLYRAKDPRLMRLYREVEEVIRRQRIDAMIVANGPPYHPDFLKKLKIYKALYSADDPGATYAINIPYLHAYDHVFFVAPSYSAEMNMTEKMHHAGMENADWLPISVFDFECDSVRSEHHVLQQERDIDLVYIGGFWRQKIETLAKVKKAFGRRFKLHGYFRLKHNIYLNVRYGLGCWIGKVSHQERVRLYQRSKIGFNIHWDDYGLGNQRLYHLPANGVMQICDCAPYLNQIYEVGREVVSYTSSDDLIEKIRYYLLNDTERVGIAARGYHRTMKDYRFVNITRHAGRLIRAGIDRSTRNN